MTETGTGFAFYGRVSTEDHQDPVTSLGWQRHAAMDLIKGHGVVTQEFFDVGTSRSLPWQRRPEAHRLLTAVASTDRSFDAIVIGEPQRAFFGAQFSNTFPLLQHHGVDLWVPDVGGRVDPDSDIHDLMMGIFGNVSKSERRRVQKRVIGAMEAATITSGRFLGGRPPYGYTIVSLGPHPHPGKASDGIELHGLGVNIETAPVVQEIFAMYLRGTGLRTIASRLNDQVIPCPSAHDPDRNSHRRQDGWQTSTLRAILTNPRYTGLQVWGRAHRVERLLDPTDVAAGTVTVFKRSAPERVVTSTELAHPAIVSVETFDSVQELLAWAGRAASSKPRSARRSVHPFVLRGLVHCSACGRRMQGHARGQTLYLRCRARDLLPGQAEAHPTTVNVREDALVPAVEAWVMTLFSPERITETTDALMAESGPSLAEATRRSGLDRRVRDAERKLAQFKDALGKGADATHVVKWINDAALELANAQADRAAAGLADDDASGTQDALLEVVADVAGVAARLSTADAGAKTTLFTALGLHIVFDHEAQEARVEISTQDACGKRGVRGGT